MDRSMYGEGDTTSEPYGLTYQPFRLTKKETPAPGCKSSSIAQFHLLLRFILFGTLSLVQN